MQNQYFEKFEVTWFVCMPSIACATGGYIIMFTLNLHTHVECWKRETPSKIRTVLLWINSL